MFGARQSSSNQSSAYASAADFHRLFMKDMNRLYTLSLLLTADHSLAEECLVRGLDDSSSSTRIFKEWLQSWATRTIIQNAIQIIRPRPGDRRMPDRQAAVNQPAELAAVMELPPFERFAFVLSVLERYSDQECSLLLNTNRGEVIAARIRALQSIGSSAELRYQWLGIDPSRHLAVSA